MSSAAQVTCILVGETLDEIFGQCGSIIENIINIGFFFKEFLQANLER